MKIRLVSLALIAAFLGAFALAPLSVSAAQGSAGYTMEGVTGAVTDAEGNVREFTGDLTLSRFVDQSGALAVVGSLTGTYTDSDGVAQAVSEQFTAPIQSIAVFDCQILNLDIGAIHLDLLGLVVDVAPIAIDITAVPGAGNLLGNLLCAVAGLLDGGGLLSVLVGLLNDLLDQLG